jgi:hypothetical protein
MLVEHGVVFFAKKLMRQQTTVYAKKIHLKCLRVQKNHYANETEKKNCA